MVGTSTEAECLKLRAVRAPVGVEHSYPAKATVYQRPLPPGHPPGGKLTMQKIERKHVPWRARLKRLPHKTLSFSRSCLKHDLTIGLYMNDVDFGCTAYKEQLPN